MADPTWVYILRIKKADGFGRGAEVERVFASLQQATEAITKTLLQSGDPHTISLFRKQVEESTHG